MNITNISVNYNKIGDKMKISNVEEYIKKCEEEAKNEFEKIDDIALFNQKKVLDAFREHRVSPNFFYPSTGYGYDDVGRDKLRAVFSSIMHTEDSIISPLIANGTHALTLALFGLLRPNDTLLTIAGKPYDTLDDVINGTGNGSLKDFGVHYECVDLTEKGEFDYKSIKNALQKVQPKVVFIQRSKGYAWREALSVEKIGDSIDFVKKITPDSIIVVDNCYGEFVQKIEPSDVGADVIVGSLIKNPGAGIAPTGAYIAGKSAYIEQISYRFTAPSLGLEVGSSIGGYLPYYQGLFLAPSTVKNALKGSILAGYALREFGFETMPKPGEMPYDIIKSIKFNDPDKMIAFCEKIQTFSPVDSHVIPSPWDMPGYNDQVIMADGAFIQGGSLELSADGPIRAPYVAYLQGGLTYEHCKIAITEIVKYFNEEK